MTGAVAVTAATLRIPESLAAPVVYQRDQFDRLVEEVSSGLGLYLVYAQDITVAHPSGWYAETVLALSVDDLWGAAYCRDQKAQWIAHNPRPLSDGVPDLVFDSEAGTSFPPGAAFPMDQIRVIVAEYLQTGQRPVSTEWYVSNQVMIY